MNREKKEKKTAVCGLFTEGSLTRWVIISRKQWGKDGKVYTVQSVMNCKKEYKKSVGKILLCLISFQSPVQNFLHIFCILRLK